MSPTEKWSAHISRQAKSGLSQAEYCRHNGLHPVTFSQWKRRLKEDAHNSGFVALALPAVFDRQSTDTAFRVLLGNGIELVFPMNAGPGHIAALVVALRGL